MYRYIVFCLCVSLSSVLCQYLNKREGDKCEWEGLSGQCVQETSCATTMDDESPKHPICTKTMKEKIVCCTDCELVNNTKNAVLTPSGLLWKNGQKARDMCLQYIQDLPYKCKGDDFFAGISRELDEENKCYEYYQWDTNSRDNNEIREEYPHTAFLGYGEDLESVEWFPRGSIISDKYILTVAYYDVIRLANLKKHVRFVLVDVKNYYDCPKVHAWQAVHTVKRFIPHPEYEAPKWYNDIGLIETENKITFNKNVLPACLHVEVADDDDETAITTNWFDVNSANRQFADINTIHAIKLDKLSDEECKNFYMTNKKIPDGIQSNTQMCYGSKSDSPDSCKKQYGEALLNSKQFSGCIYSVIGLPSFYRQFGNVTPTVYTRVAPYIPWIESVVWP